MLCTKSFGLRVKETEVVDGDDGKVGTFKAYASVFDNIDSYGDVVRKGAFLDTLAAWNEKELSIPLLWGHNMFDPDYNIGDIPGAAEDEKGLLVDGAIDLEGPASSKGPQVYRLLQKKRVGQMSFAFEVEESTPGEVDGIKVNELKKLILHEVSVVPLGANQETEILAVKAAADHLLNLKEGRVLAAKHISALTDAHAMIGAVLKAAEKEQEEVSKSAEGLWQVKSELDLLALELSV